MARSRKSLSLSAAAAATGAVIFFAALVAFAAAGLSARLWADDFCYSAVVKEDGLISGIAGWYQSNGNRLSTLVPVALADALGPNAVRFIPAAVLALWALAWGLFLRQAARAVGRDLPAVWAALLALAAAYYAALLAPDRLQTVYWRMGVFHYSLPVPLMLLTLALALRWLRAGRGLAWRAALVALAAFFTAGLSETGAALQVGVLLTGLALALRLLAPGERGRAGFLFGGGLAGSLLMMAVMSLAPANAWRQAVMPPPENPLIIAPVSARFAADFIFFSLRGRPTAFLAFLLLPFSAALLLSRGWINPRKAAGWLLAAALLSLVACYGWVVFSFAPSVFAGLQYPAGRAQMPAHFALLAGLGAAAFFAGLASAAVLGGRAPRAQTWLALALLAAACLYPFRALPVAQGDAQQLATRAARWDARAQQIRAAAEGGDRSVLVRQTDVVLGLEDLDPDPSFWINRCAAVYFDVSSITAEP